MLGKERIRQEVLGCWVYGDGGHVGSGDWSKGLRKIKNLKKCDNGWVQEVSNEM
jgi:hypothetical protein